MFYELRIRRTTAVPGVIYMESELHLNSCEVLPDEAIGANSVSFVGRSTSIFLHNTVHEDQVVLSNAVAYVTVFSAF